MRKIFALALVIGLLLIAMIPQVEAGWPTYKDKKGRFEMKYPAGWDICETEVDLGELGRTLTVVFTGPNDVACAAVISKNFVPFMKGKWMDEIDTDDENETVRLINFSGKDYAGIFTFTAPPKDFDSVNKTFFDPMIKSIKVK
jgi:hypothetical protein